MIFNGESDWRPCAKTVRAGTVRDHEFQEKSVAVKAAEAIAAAVASAPMPVTVPETAPVAAAFVGASVAMLQ